MEAGIKIFVSHSPDNRDQMWRHPYFEHIIAGSTFRTEPFPQGMIRDDTGENISHKNRSYCELTAQYWAWKNAEADYYGFCHYRRILSFTDVHLQESDSGSVIRPTLDSALSRELGLGLRNMSDKIRGQDMIVAKGIPVAALQAKDLVDHYRKARHLRVEDLYAMLEVIRTALPEMYMVAERYLHGKLFYPCNVFIAKRNVFMEYSDRLFSVLKETEKQIPMDGYSREGRRTMGHLGERFLGIYYEYLRALKGKITIEGKKEYRLQQRQMVLLEHAEKKPILQPKKDEVTIVMAANEQFVPVLSVCLHSIRDQKQETTLCRVYVLHQDISERSCAGLRKELESVGFEIVFVDVSIWVAGYSLKGKNHISQETYYRFLIKDLFKHYKRVLYLDCDMVIRRDLTELFCTDIGESWLAAAPDLDFIGQCNGANPDTMAYCENVLKLKNPLAYFQAGVLLFDIRKTRENLETDLLMDMAQDTGYIYSDQDILNVLCEGRAYRLPVKWNVMTDSINRIAKAISYSPAQLFDEYEAAREDPWIIHYAGADKPWKDPCGDYAEEFWKVARKSAYYEALLAKLVERNEKHAPGGAVVDSMRRTAKKVLPEGSWIRRQVGAMYWRMK